MEKAERKRRADFRAEDEGYGNGVRNPEKLIELEGEGHLAIACLDIEADEEAKAVEEGRKMEEERRMNKIIALEEEMRLKMKMACGRADATCSRGT
ncbi:hypothetical protein TNCV_4764311 [Trichonephila clavipes]|nr:hypothetical protein TNCV_4764311 [Trichonephila clavipes]